MPGDFSLIANALSAHANELEELLKSGKSEKDLKDEIYFTIVSIRKLEKLTREIDRHRPKITIEL